MAPMQVLIVHAHSEPTSFNGALTRTAIEALTAAGHRVTVSDLYAMGFDPVSDRRNFTCVRDPDVLRQQDEEALASREDGFEPRLQAEMDQLAAADVVIFQFPIWWLGMPAIMKGWIDRVFAVGRAYGGGRWFEGGVFRGKRAMLSVTVGGHQPVYSEQGVYGDLDAILYPIHRGILQFTGFSVMEPFIVYAPGRIVENERQAYLNLYRERLLSLESAPVLAMPDMTGFDGLARRQQA